MVKRKNLIIGEQILSFKPIRFEEGRKNENGRVSSSEGTLMCLSIGTPKNNNFSICSKWKIHYF